MKYYMSLIAAAALALSACGDNKPAEQPAAPPAKLRPLLQAKPPLRLPASAPPWWKATTPCSTT